MYSISVAVALYNYGVGSTESTNSRIVSVVDDELDIIELFYDTLRTIEKIKVFKFTNPIMALEHFKINRRITSL
jgi:hypothetical protein